MTMLNKINQDQRLYVTKCGPGYSCLGFDVCERRIRNIAAWLGAPVPKSEIGTAERYRYYETLCAWGFTWSAYSKDRCNADLSPQLIGLEGKRVEVTLPDGDRSRFWVGKSTGWFPIHLEIQSQRSDGGGGAYLPEGSTVRVIQDRH